MILSGVIELVQVINETLEFTFLGVITPRNVSLSKARYLFLSVNFFLNSNQCLTIKLDLK